MEIIGYKYDNMLQLDASSINELLSLHYSISLVIEIKDVTCVTKVHDNLIYKTHNYFGRYDKNIFKLYKDKYNKILHGLSIIAHTLINITNTMDFSSSPYWYSNYRTNDGYLYPLTQLADSIITYNTPIINDTCVNAKQLIIDMFNDAIFLDKWERVNIFSVDFEVLKELEEFFIDIVYVLYVLSDLSRIDQIRNIGIIKEYTYFFQKLIDRDVLINHTPYWNRIDSYLRYEPWPLSIIIDFDEIMDYAFSIYS